MRIIRIDDQVWFELQKRAEPFVDTPNAVLRELLGLSRAKEPVRDLHRRQGADGHRADGANRTQEREFYRPILQSVVELGGRARVADILAAVEAKVQHRLKAGDLEPIKSGEMRWKNTAKWARKYMTYREKPALLNPSSPHGWWEITDAGREYLRNTAP